LERDRVYLPLDDLERFNLTLAELDRFRLSDQPVGDLRWQRLMALEVERAARIFDEGRALPEKVGSDLRRQLRITWLGGMRILERIQAVRYDVFRRRPSLGALDFVKLYIKSWRAPASKLETRNLKLEIRN
jgi:phytoene/squalene synthetase